MHQEELNKKRRQAVAMRLEGEKIADISTATGLSAPTIIAAHKKFKQGGWDAVDSQPRGRTAGKNQRLSTEQLNRFREIVLSPPEHGLWTIASLTDYLQDTLASSVSVRTVNRYLTELGMQPDNQLRLAQQNEKFATWFEHTYPGIVASARDSTLLWAHYNTHNRDRCPNQPTLFQHNKHPALHSCTGHSTAGYPHTSRQVLLVGRRPRRRCRAPVGVCSTGGKDDWRISAADIERARCV
jgi:transposase